MARNVLIISGGLEAVPGIERVQALGLRVAVSDISMSAPGMRVADDRIVVSTYDVAATVAAAESYHKRKGIEGVLSIAADVPLTVASVAEALGLPGIPLETAKLASDKLAMKDRFRKDGVPIPWYTPVESALHLADLIAERGDALVVKPVDSRGARGVVRMAGGVDSDWAFGVAMAASPTLRVMAEEYLPGPQLSTESVILDDRAITLGCSDRNYELLDTFAPYVIENGGVQPTALLDEVLPEVNSLVLRAARSIGLDEGTLKGDLVVDPERGLTVIEVAPRLSGGWFCTDQIPLSTGVDLVQVAARIAVGEALSPAEVEPRSWNPVAVRYFFPPPGILRAVEGFDDVAAEPWVHRAVLFAEAGDTLKPVTDHTKRAGLVITIGDSREEAVRRAEEAVERVRFEVEA